MKILSGIVGLTAVMGAYPDRDDCDRDIEVKLRGKFEAVAKVEADFLKKVELKHGPHFDLTCAKLCFLTPACRFDPHEHWSYCKDDHHPAVCFGLYRVPKRHHCDHKEEEKDIEYEGMHGIEDSESGMGYSKKFGKLCYQPTQPFSCPEKFPVYCKGRPHPHKYDGEMLE